MSTNQAMQWITIGAALLAAGIWLGALQNRVQQLERGQTYYHGRLASANPQEE